MGMAKKYKTDLVGKRYGSLVGIRLLGSHKKHGSLWLWKCDCGKEYKAYRNCVVPGYTRSCGCARLKHTIDIHMRTNSFSYVPAEQYKKITRTYQAMVCRCYVSSSPYYHRYGGRGITVCREWLESIGSFITWAYKNGLKDKMTIDRIDNDKGYSPDNCRCISLKENANNKSSNHCLLFNGASKTIAEIETITGIPRHRIYNWCSRHGDEEALRRIYKALQ